MKDYLILSIIALAFITFIIMNGFPSCEQAEGLPNRGEYKGLRKYMEQVTESDIENPRTTTPTRKASLNKKPWLADNLQDMELMIWPDFGGRGVIDDNDRWSNLLPESGRGPRNPIQGWIGCILWCDKIITDCTEAFECKLARYTGIITKVNVIGPVLDWEYKTPFAGPASIIIYPFPNTPNNTKIYATVEVVALNSKGEYLGEGYCGDSAWMLCGACDCIGVVPTIVATSATIAAGGAVNSMNVNSGGLACPPYTWTVSGLGYSIDKTETQNDAEIVNLSLAGGT